MASLAPTTDGKWLSCPVFGPRKCSACNIPIALYRKDSPQFGKVAYLNEDRWQMSRHDPMAPAVTDKNLISDWLRSKL